VAFPNNWEQLDGVFSEGCWSSDTDSGKNNSSTLWKDFVKRREPRIKKALKMRLKKSGGLV
jgi:hypothetical protein